MLDQNAIAVVNLVLNNLGCPAGEGFQPGLKGCILVLYLDFLKPLCFPGAAQQGQTALLGFIFTGSIDDFRIQHDHVSSFAVKGDDAFINTDHIGGHAHTFFLVGGQGVQQILGNLQILRSGKCGLPGQKNGVVDNGLNHRRIPFGQG